MISPIKPSNLITKPKPLPKGLIYRSPKNNVYHLIETKTGKLKGEMSAFSWLAVDPINTKGKKPVKIFYINSLEIFDRFNGWGTYFINFAKQESFKQNCEGRLHLVAYNYYDSPHVFYKKQGFVTTDKNTNKLLDSYAEAGVRAQRWNEMDMFLDLNLAKNQETKQKKSGPNFITFLKEIINFISIK